MARETRRTFLSQAAAQAAGAVAVSAVQAAHRQANDQLVFGLIGCGGRGIHDADNLLRQENVAIAHICDLDQARLAAAAEHFASHAPRATSDLRVMLDDPAVHAVIIATPNHWHSPAGILACQAKKHVYVEKPCSHNVREGRLFVEAARRNQCLVQHGTQVRSTATIQQAVQLLRDGMIGNVMAAKAWNIQRRRSIGHVQPSDPPPNFDYDTWVGPATMVPFRSNCHHGSYNWFYHFGSGDFGNDGVHDIDYARWGLGVETHPARIAGLGGKYQFDDDQQYPDTQQVTFVYPGDGAVGQQRMLIYEQRLWSTNYPYNTDSGAEFYGTGGQMFVSRRGKLQVLNDRNERVPVDVPLMAQDDLAHVANFVEAIRHGVPLNAEIEIGHLTASLCHLGNISTRLGRALEFDPIHERIQGDEEADRLLRREYRPHWGTPAGV